MKKMVYKLEYIGCTSNILPFSIFCKTTILDPRTRIATVSNHDYIRYFAIWLLVVNIIAAALSLY